MKALKLIVLHRCMNSAAAIQVRAKFCLARGLIRFPPVESN